MEMTIGFFNGDQIEYTGNTVDGFVEFVYLEGTKVGSKGYRLSTADKDAESVRRVNEYKTQQAEFARLRTA